MRTRTEFLVFRHGETDWNRARRWQGHTDIPLNELGRTQARDLAPKLRDAQVAVIVSSDLSRARETAQLAAAGLAVPIVFHKGLREAHLGDAQGLTADEVVKAFGEELPQRWRAAGNGDLDLAFPGGESQRALRTRAVACLEVFAAGYAAPGAARVIGVATHAGVVKQLARHAQPDDTARLSIANGTLHAFSYEPPAGNDPLGGRWTYLGMR